MPCTSTEKPDQKQSIFVNNFYVRREYGIEIDLLATIN